MIFYFSATGNSRHAAAKIAERNGDRLISIAKAMKTGELTFQAGAGEDIGIVTPVPVSFGDLRAACLEFSGRRKIKNHGIWFLLVWVFPSLL